MGQATLLVGVILVSCKQKVSHAENLIEHSSTSEDCHPGRTDTVLTTGHTLKYLRDNGRIRIQWGNDSFNRSLQDDFSCDIADARMLRIEWSSAEFIGLRYGCGNPCWGIKILPLNPSDSVIERMYQLDVLPTKNLLAYLGGEHYDILTIENLIDGKKQEIKSTFKCGSAFQGYCIDSVKLSEKTLKVWWNDLDSNGKSRKKTMDEIQLALR